MKERPILFKAEMVRALLDGRKTQTRRVISPVQPRDDGLWPAGRNPVGDCPYGQPGDRLWVRERFCAFFEDTPENTGEVFYAADPPRPNLRFMWRPSIFMPRRASRITLELTDVRVERLQNISEEDAKAEGVWPAFSYPGWDGVADRPRYVWGFHEFWDSINTKHPWKSNPRVRVLEFKVCK